MSSSGCHCKDRCVRAGVRAGVQGSWVEFMAGNSWVDEDELEEKTWD